MPKYSKELTKRITDLISSDEYTIAEICHNVGISEAIYFRWKVEKVEFLEAIKKADIKRLEHFKNEARKGILKKLTGYDYEEVSTTVIEGKDGKPKIKEKKTVKKHVPPDTAILIFTAKNTDPDNFKDRQEIDHTMNINTEKARVASLFPTEDEWNNQQPNGS